MAHKIGFSRVALVMIVCLLGIGLLPPRLTAQYFGQNKVRYESLDFKVLKTDHFA